MVRPAVIPYGLIDLLLESGGEIASVSKTPTVTVLIPRVRG